jgi:hypothetical protein
LTADSWVVSDSIGRQRPTCDFVDSGICTASGKGDSGRLAPVTDMGWSPALGPMSAVAIYQPLGTPAMLRDIHDDLDAPELEAARRAVELQMAAAALGDGIQGKFRYPASRNRSPGRGPESALRWHSSSWCSNSGPGRARDKAPVAGELESLVPPLVRRFDFGRSDS